MIYTLADYAVMLTEDVRATAYANALRAVVTPGCVVADIGAGPGALGVYAALLGARRVYLVEPDSAVAAAVALAEENGVRDRIEIIRGSSTEITLPERADVIVSDLRGVLPLFMDHLRVSADMLTRHLAPNGVCIPLRDTLHACLVEDAELHARVTGMWTTMHVPVRHASLDQLAANAWKRTNASPESVIGAPVHWATLDYGMPAPRLDGVWTTTMERDRTIHGILGWFDAELTSSVGFSNSPLAPPALYGQAYFPIAAPMALIVGDVVHCRLRATLTADEYAWAWSVRAERAGVTVGEARQASLLGRPIDRTQLERRRGSHVPRLSTNGEIARDLLVAADGTRDLASLAEMIHERYPARFPSALEALAFVSQHEPLWS